MSQPVPECVSRYAAVCFDLFGTLVEITDQRGAWRDALALIPRERRREFKWRIMRENRPMEKLISELNPTADLSAWNVVVDNSTAEVRSTQIRAGMFGIWSVLQSNGQKLGICSNLSLNYGPPAMEQLPTPPDVRALSYELGFAKPDAEIYKYVLDSFGYRPEQVLFVGDTAEADILVPRRLGIDAMHVCDFERLFSVPG